MNRWDLWETTERIYDTTVSNDGYPILLADKGKILKMGAGSNHKDWIWESKKITFGTDTNYKKVRVAKFDASSRVNTDLQYKTNDVDSWQNGTDVSDKYGSAWTGHGVKISSTYSKLRWLKLKATGDNNTVGSNIKGYSLGVVFKPKKPK